MNLQPPPSHCKRLLILFAALHGICNPSFSLAMDDEVPFFIRGRGIPNVMIIFDNSDSMQESPVLRDDGITPFRPINQPWKKGVMVSENCGVGDTTSKCLADETPGTADAIGKLRFEDQKHITPVDEQVSLPGKTPPHLPGKSTSFSEVTSISGNRIYDTSVTWSLLNEGSFNSTYKDWRVIVTDLKNSSKQERKLSGYHSDGYWVVSGGSLDYDNTHGYSYRLLGSIPGKVTVVNDTDDIDKVYDSNIDWALFSQSFWNLQYKDRELEVTAGTNSGQKKKITSVNPAEGYWEVESFTVPCDTTSRYRILVGTRDDGKLAYGGNHPDSKLYQAKAALAKFLDSDAIKVCDMKDAAGNCTTDYRYLMNVGFATYMQAVVPTTTALYYTVVYGQDIAYRISVRYWQNQKMPTEYYEDLNGPEGGVNFLDTFGEPRNGMSVGSAWAHTESFGGWCPTTQKIYRCVTSITAAPTDTNPGRVMITVESNPGMENTYGFPDQDEGPSDLGKDPAGNRRWGYTRYDDLVFYPAETVNCSNFTPPKVKDGWTLVERGQYCEKCQTHSAVIVPDSYNTRHMQTTGDESVTDPQKGGYITRNPGYLDDIIVKPMPTFPYVYADRPYILVEGQNVEIKNRAGNVMATVSESIFNESLNVYPADENDDRPHGWSYQKTSVPKIFKKGWNTEILSTWKTVDQSPNFPSRAGAPGLSNFNGDDHTAFVDLPEYNASDPDNGDDIYGGNITKIKKFINLDRAQHPANPIFRQSLRPEFVGTTAPFSPLSLPMSTLAKDAKGTPLAASLANARRYYNAYKLQDPLSSENCRRNFVILITDGLDTCGGDLTPAEEAAELAEMGIKVFVIGFGLDTASKANLNTIAEKGGTGHAYFASTGDELEQLLSKEIAKAIRQGSFSRSKIVTSSVNRNNKDELYHYYGYFDYPEWGGHLISNELDPKTSQVKTVQPLLWKQNCSGGQPDAGCIMAEDYDNIVKLSTRTIYTSIPGDSEPYTIVPFEADTTATELTPLQRLVNPGGLDINQNGTPNEVADANEVIEYVRHPGYPYPESDRTSTPPYMGTRNPDSPLADIYNSSPVIVSEPFIGECYDHDADPTTPMTWGKKDEDMPGYCNFYEENKDRVSMVYVGSNGGMIEAIVADNKQSSPSGGNELWGYVPRNVLGKLHEFKDGHRFTMDLSIAAAEVDTSGSDTQSLDGTGWKTMLVAGQRQGGNSYTALDVTYPSNPVPMWEFTDPNLGQTWAPPSFGRIMINGVKTSVVFFGGGYSADVNVGNRIFIVRARDGIKLLDLGASNPPPTEPPDAVGDPLGDVPGGLRTMRYLTDKVGTVVDYRTNLAQLPDGTVVDYSERKYMIEAVYFGDIKGSIWRLDNLNNMAGTTWNELVTLTKIYTPPAGKDMPIYYRPAVHDIKDGSLVKGIETGCVKRYIVAATGDEKNPLGKNDDRGMPILNYAFEIEETVPTVETAPKSILKWRITLGLRLPQDAQGEVLNKDGGAISGTKVLAEKLGYLWVTDDNGIVINSTGSLEIDTNDYFDTDGKLRTIEGATIVRAAGEKVLSEPAIQAGSIAFTSYAPRGACSGESFLYGVTSATCTSLGAEGWLKGKGNEDLGDSNSVHGLGEGLAGPVEFSGPLVNTLLSTGGEVEPYVEEVGVEGAKILYWKQE